MDKFETVYKLVERKINKVRNMAGERGADKIERACRTKLELETCIKFGVDYIQYCDYLETNKPTNK